ncbi:MAG: acetylxylan esterase, partial [Bacteroidota bacterium]
MLFREKLTLCVLLCSAYCASLYAQDKFLLSTSRLDNTFQTDDSMTFNIEALESGQVTYSIRYDAVTQPLREGELALAAGQSHEIDFTLEQSGTVWFEVQMNGQSDLIAATFSPFHIEALEAEPNDFDDFWTAQKAKLAKIPIDAKVVFHQEGEYSTCYEVSLGMIDARRVYSYICVPKGTGSYPAVLTLPAFGANPNLVKPLPEIAERVGALSMSISIHNAPPGERVINPYRPDNPAKQEENHFRYAILASLRAIDYMKNRADFNGKLAVTGTSQGGGLAIMTAGLEEDVDLLVFSNPTHAQHQGFLYGFASGFPYYLEQIRVNVPNDFERFKATADAIQYYDAIYFAKRFQGTTLGIVGYKDQICPSATTFAAFNQLSGKKILFHGINLGHQHPNVYWQGQQDAFRRFLQPEAAPPFPYASQAKGYDIEMTAPDTIYPNETVILNGLALRNEGVLSEHIVWEKVSGNGRVDFEQNNRL